MFVPSVVDVDMEVWSGAKTLQAAKLVAPAVAIAIQLQSLTTLKTVDKC
jgi:hypothetical protein